jgi:general secretion pathway protein L
MRQIVPFSLEDVLADDVEGLTFAVGTRLSGTATAVAVVGKSRLDGWLAELAAAGIVPQALYSETEGVPDVPATLMLLLEGERVYARRPGQPPFVLEGVPLRQVVDLLRAGGADELRYAIAYADPDTRAHLQDEIGGLADDFESAEAKVAVDGLFPHFAATLAQRPGTNLLQGPYAPKSNWLELARPWRVAAALLGVALLLGIVLQGAEYWRLRGADNDLGTRLATTCQQVVGTNRTSACDAEIQKRLHQSGKSAETFLTTLEAIAAMRDPALRIDALTYRNRITNVQLIAGDVGALDKFARDLEQTHRFAPKIESANQGTGGIEGRLQIAPK